MLGRNLLLFLLLSSLAPSAHAHGVDHSVAYEDAFVVRLSYRSGAPFAGARVEISRVGESTTVFEGRTDARGMVAFLPTDEGPWRCRAFSDDGHGTQFEFDAPPREGSPPLPASTSNSRVRDIGAGLAILVLLFGLLRGSSALLHRRRRRRTGHVPDSPGPSRA